MALFDENVTITPAPRRRRARSVGVWALTVALVVLVILTFLPTAFVIERPGPVFNTLGSATTQDGSRVPLITVADAKTHPTAGTLDMLTVQVVGNPSRTATWPQVLGAWFDPARAVMPVDAVFPAGQSADQRTAESAAMMVDSQQEATAAALTHLGYDVHARLVVHSVIADGPAHGILRADDVIERADGTATPNVTVLRRVIADAAGAPVTLSIRRDGTAEEVTVTPQKSGASGWIVGVTLTTGFTFPIDVTIRLDDVGGPSAGMMFALGVIDKLTPGHLNGGAYVAGTGTIDAAGTVGAIGGIRQKMFGAVRADPAAQYFLAPASNCDEVVGHVPDGLRVFSVKTLDDALTVLHTISDHGDLAALPTCR